MSDVILAGDAALLRAIFELPRPGWLTWAMAAASLVGIGGAIWIAVGVVLALARQIPWRAFLRLAVAIALVHLVIDLGLKPWIDRPRPPLTLAELEIVVEVPETRSFPSGHAANAVAGAVVLTRVWRRGHVWVWTAAAIVAVARVYLGIHYPLDALAGAVIGLACAWMALRPPSFTAAR